MEWDRIEWVWSEFMISNNDLHHIYLDSSFNIGIFALSGTESLNLKCLILHFRYLIFQSSKHCIIANGQALGSLDDVRNIKILSIVPSDDIWIHLLDEVSPGLQKLCFFFETVHLRSYDLGTCI